MSVITGRMISINFPVTPSSFSGNSRCLELLSAKQRVFLTVFGDFIDMDLLIDTNSCLILPIFLLLIDCKLNGPDIIKMIRDQLRDLLDAKSETTTLLVRIQQAVDEEGSRVYAELLSLLTSLELGEQAAMVHWRGIVDNWRQLREKLGRDVSLPTAVCDYFSQNQGFIRSPKLIDSHIYEATVQIAYVDKLTGLYNRRYIDEVLEREVALANRHRNELSLLFFDIDNFKDINDTHGHAAGDQFLKMVAEIIRKSKRIEDISCRYGGEEMLLILPNTAAKDALTLGKRILKLVEDSVLEYEDKRISTTISGGVASYPRFGLTPTQLLQGCDAALYRSKGAGKNTISLPSIDKRRSLRVGAEVPVKVRRFGREDDGLIDAHGHDISLGGFRFKTSATMEPGSLIEAVIKLPDGEVMLLGTIVRISNEGDFFEVAAEISYKEMDKNYQYAISSFLADNGRRLS